jgi:hypothetical protein
MQEVESTEIAGTEIEIGDILALPVSRSETISHLEVIGIDQGDDTNVYLKRDGVRYTLSTAEAIAFAVLTGDAIGPVEILAVEVPENLQPAGDGGMPRLEDIKTGGAGC